MKHVRLIAVSDDYDSKPGLIIKGTPSFDELMADRDGSLIAHDLLEHQNGLKNMGPVWDELEALGGVWYCRGQWGDLGTPSMWSPAQNVASDVQRMLIQWTCEDREYCGPGGLSVGSRPFDYDEDFNAIIDIARNMIGREHGDEYKEQLAVYLTLALHRMRSGFRKAKRRFERDAASRFNGNSLFAAVKEACQQAVKHIDYEGQEFRLSYGNGEARVVEIWGGAEIGA